MPERPLEELSPAEKKRVAYIEGRPDLFETKILKFLKRESGAAAPAEIKPEEVKNILVISRDPGSANALLPVLKELIKRRDTQITTITDGRAQEIFEKNFQTQNITPQTTMVLSADQTFSKPDLILMNVSSGEMGLDTYASATYPEIPKVLVEDYYTTAAKFISKIRNRDRDRNLPLPDKICVMDEEAKEIITRKFSDLEDRVEVTGQPAFDRFAGEDTEKISREVKKELGIQPNDKLISYMSTMDELEKIMQLAEALKKIDQDFYFVFRRHLRDNVSYDAYKQIFVDAGIKILDTDRFSTDEIGAASDVVLTTWSIEGLNGIYRRKPTVHIVDKNFQVAEGLELPLAPVKLGASIGADNINELVKILPQLLDSNSPANSSLRGKMERYYKADGKNASRVVEIINKVIK